MKLESVGQHYCRVRLMMVDPSGTQSCEVEIMVEVVEKNNSQHCSSEVSYLCYQIHSVCSREVSHDESDKSRHKSDRGPIVVMAVKKMPPVLF